MSKNKSRFDLRRLLNRKQHQSVSSISDGQETDFRSGTDNSTAEPGSVNQNKNADEKPSENHATRTPPVAIDNPSVVGDASIDLALRGRTAPAEIKNNCMSFYLNANNAFSE